MRAAFINKYGHDQKLVLGELPSPTPGPSDILVKIHAASVNPIDFKIRDGKLRPIRGYPFPLIFGHDCAGEVIAVGNQVSRFKIGDRIFSRPRNGRTGTFAEFIAIDQDEAALMPKNLTFEEAASLPLVGLTSWQAFQEVARLKPGQRILIQAGSGGIGTFAIQLAKHIGAEVWTTTSGKNVDFVKSLGADHVIDYQKESFENRVSGLDVVFDTLGGDSLNRSFSAVRPGGWIVSISGSPNYRTAQDMELSLGRSMLLGLVGIPINLKAWRAHVNYRFIFVKPSGSELAEIAKLADQGAIKPVLAKVFSFQECQAAVDYSESGRARGKIVVSLKT